MLSGCDPRGFQPSHSCSRRRRARGGDGGRQWAGRSSFFSRGSRRLGLPLPLVLELAPKVVQARGRLVLPADSSRWGPLVACAVRRRLNSGVPGLVAAVASGLGADAGEEEGEKGEEQEEQEEEQEEGEEEGEEEEEEEEEQPLTTGAPAASASGRARDGAYGGA